MALFSRNRAERREHASFTRVAVTAAAQRIDLTNSADVAKLKKLQQQWQQDARYYVDLVGEMKYAELFIANAFRRIRLFAAYIRDPDSEPISVHKAIATTNDDAELPSGDETPTTAPGFFLDEKWATAAAEIVDGFASRDGGQAMLLERLGTNLFIVGECYIIERKKPTRAPRLVDDGFGGQRIERRDELPTELDWEVRAVDEVRTDPADDKRVVVVDTPDQRDGERVEPDAYVERVWRRHAHWSGWADSNVRSAIGTLELLDLLERLARASTKSRLVAGIAKVPDELDFGGPDAVADGDGASHKTVAFERELDELFSSVVGDEADSASVAPAILRGPKDLLDSFGIVEIPRRYGSEERELNKEAVQKLARTLDLPVEVLLGHMNTTFANAQQIDEDKYRDHLEPLMSIGTEALTFGLLRPKLEALGCPPDVLARLVVAADPSGLVTAPDRGDVATKGHERMALSDDAWRRANSFGDDDAPSDDELARRTAAARGRIDTLLSARMLEQAGVVPEGTSDWLVTNDSKASQAPAIGASAAVVAAASRRRTPGHVLGSRLRAIDSRLRDRLLAEADAAVLRALERAGARLRSRARTPAARVAVAAAKNVANRELCAAVGAAVVADTLGTDPISDDDFADLQTRFEQLTADAQRQALVELERTVTLTDAQRAALTSKQDDDRKAAWLFVLAQLVAYTGWRLTAAEDDLDTTGEFTPTAVVRPSLMRAALAIAGGVAIAGTTLGGVERADGNGPAGGVATGDTILSTAAEAGATVSNYVWVYGTAPRVTPYEDHVVLDGIEFSSWDDPVLDGNEPGDHAYCQCDYDVVFDVADDQES